MSSDDHPQLATGCGLINRRTEMKDFERRKYLNRNPHSSPLHSKMEVSGKSTPPVSQLSSFSSEARPTCCHTENRVHPQSPGEGAAPSTPTPLPVTSLPGGSPAAPRWWWWRTLCPGPREATAKGRRLHTCVTPPGAGRGFSEEQKGARCVLRIWTQVRRWLGSGNLETHSSAKASGWVSVCWASQSPTPGS